MPITLGSNIASLTAQRRLSEGTNSLAASFERLSSGLRINRASDDAAGLAIASSLRATSRVFTQAIRNVNDGFSVLSIAQGALTELSGISIRQRELAEQAANGSYSLHQRRSLNAEANALVEEFNRIVASVDFNGRKLFDGSPGEGLRIQAGYGIDGSVAFGLGDELERTVGDGTFKSRISFATGTSPYSVTSGDLNGDGIPDLVSADGGTDTLSVMLGNGDGTFGARRSVSAGSGPYFVAIGDFNGDGINDLVSADSVSGTLSVYLGNGDGSFRARNSFAVGQEPRSIIVNDINGDGVLDLISGDRFSSTVSVLLGNGDGTFLARSSFITSGGLTSSLAFADFNGDGFTDLVSADAIFNLSILFGNGNGSFQAAMSVRTPSSPISVVAGDFNMDGIPDLAYTDLNLNTVNILIGNGDGTFQMRQSLGVGTAPRSVASGDFNGDGILDMIVGDYGSSTISVMLGNKDGSFSGRITFGTGGSPRSALVADLDGDGVSDIVTADRGSQSLSVLLGNDKLTTFSQYLNINTRQGALDAMAVIDATLNRISSELGAIGSTQSRLGVALDNLAVARENFDAAAGRIQDADVASESANLVRTGILQRAAAAVLAQANLQPQIALTLLE